MQGFQAKVLNNKNIGCSERGFRQLRRVLNTMSQPAAWVTKINDTVAWCLRHWLLFANGLVLLYGGLPWLSPLLFAEGYSWWGRLIFLIYAPFCHQEPERSFFVQGYQVAFCERESAMYTALFVGGLLFGLLRQHIRPISLRAGGLLLLPMLLDGGTHMLNDILGGIRSPDHSIGSFNFWMRMITGLLFALAAILTIYPRLDRDMREVGSKEWESEK